MVLSTLKKDMEKFEERLKTLELIIFKEKSFTTFNEMRIRIEREEENVPKEIAEVHDLV